jgi:hypothetical protein
MTTTRTATRTSRLADGGHPGAGVVTEHVGHAHRLTQCPEHRAMRSENSSAPSSAAPWTIVAVPLAAGVALCGHLAQRRPEQCGHGDADERHHDHRPEDALVGGQRPVGG